MVRKRVSRINSHISIVMEVRTSIEPSTIVGLNLGEMKTHHSSVLGYSHVFSQNSVIGNALGK